MLLLIIDQMFMVYMIMLLARIVGSWIPELFQYRFMQFIVFCTDPYLQFFRRIIPPFGMLDISPIFAFLALGFIEYLVKGIVVFLLY